MILLTFFISTSWADNLIQPNIKPSSLDKKTAKSGETAKDWGPGETSSMFTYGLYGYNWVDDTNNPDLKDTQDGEVFFAYILGKENHSSALVRVHAKRESVREFSNVLTFTFDIIEGQLDDDFESKLDYVTKLLPPDSYSNSIAFKTNTETLPSENNLNFDNIVYPEYKDSFLSELSEPGNIDANILADFLPSHLLYSVENYLWDKARFEVVPHGLEIENPYIESRYNSEGTIADMFSDFKKSTKFIPKDENRIPIIFVHGWQGDLSDAYNILEGYSFSTTGNIKDQESSGDEYWRNLLTYMVSGLVWRLFFRFSDRSSGCIIRLGPCFSWR